MLLVLHTAAPARTNSNMAINAEIAKKIWASKTGCWVYDPADLCSSRKPCSAYLLLPDVWVRPTVASLIPAVNAAKAPEHLIVILEGESLFNDATSIVLFQIFFQAVQNLGKHQPAFRGSIMQQAMTISKKIVSLAAGWRSSLQLWQCC